MISYERLQRTLFQPSRTMPLRGLRVEKAWEEGAPIIQKPDLPLSATGSLGLEGVTLRGAADKENELTCYFNNWCKIDDLTPRLQEVFGDEFYTCVFEDDTGFWEALLFALDAKFMTNTPVAQAKMIQELKHELGSHLHECFEKNRYSLLGFDKNLMLSLLQSKNMYNSSMGHLVADFFHMNIVVINADNSYYYLGQDREDVVTLFMWKQDCAWGSVVHANGKKHLFSPPDTKEIVKNLFLVGSQKDPRRQGIQELSPLERATLKKELRMMKIKEIQTKALDLQIGLLGSEGKKKVKGLLQQEIFYCLTGCEFV